MIDGGWVPYIFGAITAAILIRVVKGAYAARYEEEELVTYEYMTLSVYWDDLADLLNKTAEEGWEADEVWAPGEEDEEPTYRILLRKEK